MTCTVYYPKAAAEPPLAAPEAQGQLEAETVIVGGGLAGVATALSLAERGHCALLLEAQEVGAGASGRNGGMVSAGFTASLEAIAARVGDQAAAELYRLSLEAVRGLKKRIVRHAVRCAPAAGVLEASWFATEATLRPAAAMLNRRFGTRLETWSCERVRGLYRTSRYHGGVFDPDALHLDPLALVRGLARAARAKGALLFEQSPVKQLAAGRQGWRLRTAQAEITARQVVLATSVYGPGLWPPLERALVPVITYIIVTEPLGTRLDALIRGSFAVYDDRFAIGYYRKLGDGRLLWGGRIGVFDKRRGLARLMRRDLARIYPELADVPVAYAWSGRMAFARHAMPIVRELAPGLWAASGFAGHGLNTTMMAGELLAAALTEGDRRYRLLEPFGLVWAGGPFGRLLAQALYWRHAFFERLAAGSAAWIRGRGI